MMRFFSNAFGDCIANGEYFGLDAVSWLSLLRLAK